MSTARRPRFEVYVDSSGEHRWRLRAANGRVVADCAEGYRTRRACLAGIDLVATMGPADVEFLP